MDITLSLIIPAYNEAHYIEDCLAGISQSCQQANIQAEIIVIDNGSTDNTADLARRFTTKVFSIERTSISDARNLGVSKATHPIIAFIDSDVVITSTWAQTFIGHYQTFIDAPLFIAGCKYAVRSDPSWIEKYWFDNIKENLLNGGNIITSKAVFTQINGFDVSLKTGEDYDFCVRAMAANAKLIIDSSFEAIHLGYPRDLKNFMKREIWHGEGDFLSFRHFIRSPVATIAAFYIFIQAAAIIFLLTNQPTLGFIAIFALLLLNAAITIKRFKSCSWSTILVNNSINYFYFCARFVSAYKAINNRSVKY